MTEIGLVKLALAKEIKMTAKVKAALDAANATLTEHVRINAQLTSDNAALRQEAANRGSDDAALIAALNAMAAQRPAAEPVVKAP